MKPVPTDEITNVIGSLKTNAVPKYDRLKALLMKKLKHILPPILVKVINRHIESGIFLNSLKISPIHKSGPKNVSNNYRPIFVLVRFSKVFETVKTGQLISKYKFLQEIPKWLLV